jgi:hypothetical protein
MLLQAYHVLQQDAHQKAGRDIIGPVDLQNILPFVYLNPISNQVSYNPSKYEQ